MPNPEIEQIKKFESNSILVEEFSKWYREHCDDYAFGTNDMSAWWLNILDQREKNYTSKVTRFEVIDHTKSVEEGGGRAFNKSGENIKVELSLQDEGRTLKVFINN